MSNEEFTEKVVRSLDRIANSFSTLNILVFLLFVVYFFGCNGGPVK